MAHITDWRSVRISPASDSLPHTGQPQRVVVIDDEVYICTLISDILTEEGYVVTAARNGIEGLHAIQNVRPDLVITDIMMPGISGYELIQHLQTDASFATTPILAMSAGRQPQNLAPGVAFIPKPFDLEIFVAKVLGLIGPAEPDHG